MLSKSFTHSCTPLLIDVLRFMVMGAVLNFGRSMKNEVVLFCYGEGP